MHRREPAVLGDNCAVSDPAPSFIAVPFGDAAAAEEALSFVRDLDESVKVRDAAVVVRTDEGRIELQQTRELAAGEGLVAGGAVGLVAGVLLGLPVGGALLGLLGGAGFGLRDTGIPDPRLRRLGQDLEPGHAVLCVLVDDDGIPRARTALARYGEPFTVELAAVADP
jgi:uncharacterized membrane protein